MSALRAGTIRMSTNELLECNTPQGFAPLLTISSPTRAEPAEPRPSHRAAARRCLTDRTRWAQLVGCIGVVTAAALSTASVGRIATPVDTGTQMVVIIEDCGSLLDAAIAGPDTTLSGLDCSTRAAVRFGSVVLLMVVTALTMASLCVGHIRWLHRRIEELAVVASCSRSDEFDTKSERGRT